MAIPKLELEDKDPAQLLAFLRNMITSMTGKPAFPLPTPTLADATLVADELEAATEERIQEETIMTQKTTAEDTKVAAARTTVIALTGYVVARAEGDGAIIQLAGLPLKDASAPLGALPAPGNFRSVAGAHPGTVQLRWKPVRGNYLYEVECRLHDEVNAPWTKVKGVTKASLLVEGLVPGQLYAFRVRANGSAGPSPWSDEASFRAP